MVDAKTAELILVDFGFAKFMSPNSKKGGYIQNDRTFTKCGTPGYSAPEVLT